MLQKLASTILSRYLGDYIEDIDPSNLNMSLTQGDVELGNLNLKKTAFDSFDLPVIIKYGFLERLTMNFPWNALSSDPVHINISGVYIILSPKTIYQNSLEEQARRQKVKQLRLQMAEQSGLNSSVLIKCNTNNPNSNGKNQQGLISRMVTKIVDNIQIYFNDIHIRYEDSFSCPSMPFAIGITLNSFKMISSDEKWHPAFLSCNNDVIYKLLDLVDLAIYFNTFKSPETSDFIVYENNAQMANKMRSMIYRSDYARDCQYHDFMLHPFSATLKAIIDRGKLNVNRPRLSINTELDDIRISINTFQYKRSFDILNYFSRYMRLIEYAKFLPPLGTLSHPRLWWKFAINSVISSIHKRIWNWSYLESYLVDQREYTRLYQKKMMLTSSNKKELDTAETLLLNDMEQRLDFTTIIQFRQYANTLLKVKEKAKPSKTGGWISTWFGRSPVSTSDEKEALQEVYDIIGYSTKNAKEAWPSQYPSDYVKTIFKFSMKSTAILFCLPPEQDDRPGKNGGENQVKSTTSSSTLMSFTKEQLTLSIKLSEAGMNIVGDLSTLCVTDYHTMDGKPLQIIKPNRMRSSDLTHFAHFEFNLQSMDKVDLPINQIATSSPTTTKRIKLKFVSMPLDITFSRVLVDQVILFFEVEKTKELSDLVQVANNQFGQIRNQAAKNIWYFSQQKDTFDIDLILCCPRILVPLNFTDPSCHTIVVDLGEIHLITSPVEVLPSSNVQFTPTPSTLDSSPSLANDFFLYQRFDLQMTGLNAMLLTGTRCKWMTILDYDEQYSIVEKFDVHLQIMILSQFTFTDLPKMKLHVNLSKLHLNLVDWKIMWILDILDVLTSSTIDDLSSGRPIRTKYQPSTRYSNMNMPNKPLGGLVSKSRLLKFDKSAATQPTKTIPDLKDTPTKSAIESYLTFFYFKIGTLSITLYKATIIAKDKQFESNSQSFYGPLIDVDDYLNVPLINLEANNLIVNYHRFDMHSNLHVSLHEFHVLDQISKGKDSTNYLIVSRKQGNASNQSADDDDLNQEQHLICIEYTNILPQSKHYHNVDQRIHVKFGYLMIEFNRISVACLLQFALDFQNYLNEKKNVDEKDRLSRSDQAITSTTVDMDNSFNQHAERLRPNFQSSVTFQIQDSDDTSLDTTQTDEGFCSFDENEPGGHTTTDEEGYYVSNSSGSIHGNLPPMISTLMINIQLKELAFSLNRNGNCFLESSILSSNLDVNFTSSGIHTKGYLESILVRYPNEDFSQWSNLIHTDQCEKMLAFEVGYVNESDQVDSDIYIDIKFVFNSFYCVILYSMIQDLRSYFNAFEDIQKSVMLATNQFYKQALKATKGNVHRIKLDLMFNNPNVIVPCVQTSQHLVLDFGKISINKYFVTDLQSFLTYDTLKIDIVGLKLQTVLDAGQAPQPIIQDCKFLIICKQPIEDLAHFAPDFQLEVMVEEDINISVSDIQINLVMNILTKNLAEYKPDESERMIVSKYISNITSHLQTLNSAESTNDKISTNSLNRSGKQKLSSSRSVADEYSWIRTQMKLYLLGTSLTLLKTKPNASHILECDPIILFSIKDIRSTYSQRSNDHAEFNFLLQSVILEESRSCSTSSVPYIWISDSFHSSPNQLQTSKTEDQNSFSNLNPDECMFTTNAFFKPNNQIEVDFRLYKPRLFILPKCIQEVYIFLMDQLDLIKSKITELQQHIATSHGDATQIEGDQISHIITENGDTIQVEEGDSIHTSKSEIHATEKSYGSNGHPINDKDNTFKLFLKVRIISPRICLCETHHGDQLKAIVLHLGETNMTYDMSNPVDTFAVNVKLDNLKIFKSIIDTTNGCHIIELNRMLHPVSAKIGYNFVNGFSKIIFDIEELHTILGLRDLKSLSAVYQFYQPLLEVLSKPRHASSVDDNHNSANAPLDKRASSSINQKVNFEKYRKMDRLQPVDDHRSQKPSTDDIAHPKNGVQSSSNSSDIKYKPYGSHHETKNFYKGTGGDGNLANSMGLAQDFHHFTLSIKTVLLNFINDTLDFGLSTPLLQIIIESTYLMSKIKPEHKEVVLSLPSFQLQVYNNMMNAYEPAIEPFFLRLSALSTDKMMTLDLDVDEMIDLNIIKSLLDTSLLLLELKERFLKESNITNPSKSIPKQKYHQRLQSGHDQQLPIGQGKEEMFGFAEYVDSSPSQSEKHGQGSNILEDGKKLGLHKCDYSLSDEASPYVVLNQTGFDLQYIFYKKNSPKPTTFDLIRHGQQVSLKKGINVKELTKSPTWYLDLVFPETSNYGSISQLVISRTGTYVHHLSSTNLNLVVVSQISFNKGWKQVTFRSHITIINKMITPIDLAVCGTQDADMSILSPALSVRQEFQIPLNNLLYHDCIRVRPSISNYDWLQIPNGNAIFSSLKLLQSPKLISFFSSLNSSNFNKFNSVTTKAIIFIKNEQDHVWMSVVCFKLTQFENPSHLCDISIQFYPCFLIKNILFSTMTIKIPSLSKQYKQDIFGPIEIEPLKSLPIEIFDFSPHGLYLPNSINSKSYASEMRQCDMAATLINPEFSKLFPLLERIHLSILIPGFSWSHTIPIGRYLGLALKSMNTDHMDYIDYGSSEQDSGMKKCKFYLTDSHRRTLTLLADLKHFHTSTYQLSIYSNYCFINLTGLDLYYKGKGNHEAAGQIMADQSNPISSSSTSNHSLPHSPSPKYLNSNVGDANPKLQDQLLIERDSNCDPLIGSSSIHYSMPHYELDSLRYKYAYNRFYYHDYEVKIRVGSSKWSKLLSLGIANLGLIQIREKSDQGSIYQFVLFVKPGSGRFWRTKIVYIVPAFVLVNATSNTVLYKQAEYHRINTILPRHQHPFHWFDPRAKLQLEIGSKVSNPDRFGDLYHDFWSKPISIDALMRIQLKLKSNHSDHIFPLNLVIKMYNNTTFVVIGEVNPESIYYLPIFSYKITNNSNYSFNFKQKTSDVIYTLAGNSTMNYYWDIPSLPAPKIVLWANLDHAPQFKLSLDDVNSYPDLPAYAIPNRRGKFLLEVRWNNTDKELVISDCNDWSLLSDVPVARELKFEFNLKLYGIGISVIDTLPQEIMYLTLKSICLQACESNIDRTLSLDVQHVQIDNQLYDMIYPVVLYAIPSIEHPFFQMMLVIDTTITAFNYIRYFAVQFQEMDLEIYANFLYHLLGVFNSLNDTIYRNSSNNDEHQLLNDRPTTFQLIQPEDFQLQDIYHFDIFHLNPILINLSFRNNPNIDQEFGQVTKSTWLETILEYTEFLTNIEKAPIKLNALLLENPCSSRDDFIERLVKHYTMSVVKQGYKILGSVDFLGNPISFVSNLGTGVRDFFYEPTRGIVQSPAAFGKGLAKGTKSLLLKTSYAVFDTTSKLTDTLAKIGAKTTNRNYQMERVKRGRSQPDHALEGLQYGISDMAFGFYRGITGIITDPIKGGKEEGAIGGFKGVLSGVTGLVIKPAIGVVDLFSRTAQGFKSSASSWDKNRIPMRLARFTRPNQPISVYNLEISTCNQLFHLFCQKYVPTDNLEAHISLVDQLLIFGKSHLYSFKLITEEKNSNNTASSSFTSEHASNKVPKLIWHQKISSLELFKVYFSGEYEQEEMGGSLFKEKLVLDNQGADHRSSTSGLSTTNKNESSADPHPLHDTKSWVFQLGFLNSIANIDPILKMKPDTLNQSRKSLSRQVKDGFIYYTIQASEYHILQVANILNECQAHHIPIDIDLLASTFLNFQREKWTFMLKKDESKVGLRSHPVKQEKQGKESQILIFHHLMSKGFQPDQVTMPRQLESQGNSSSFRSNDQLKSMSCQSCCYCCF